MDKWSYFHNILDAETEKVWNMEIVKGSAATAVMLNINRKFLFVQN